MTDKAREEFEQWIQERSVDTPAGFYPQLTYRNSLDPDRYMISWVDSAWDGWQASRAALVIELPHSWETYCGTTEEFVMYANDVEDMIKDSGLKAKPYKVAP